MKGRASSPTPQRTIGGPPRGGGWTTSELVLAPAALVLSSFAIGAASFLGARIDTENTADPRAFLPLLLVVVGVALMAFGIFRLSRTVKAHAPKPPVKATLPAPAFSLRG